MSRAWKILVQISEGNAILMTHSLFINYLAIIEENCKNIDTNDFSNTGSRALSLLWICFDF
jgi:hypothetical protein